MVLPHHHTLDVLWNKKTCSRQSIYFQKKGNLFMSICLLSKKKTCSSLSVYPKQSLSLSLTWHEISHIKTCSILLALTIHYHEVIPLSFNVGFPSFIPLYLNPRIDIFDIDMPSTSNLKCFYAIHLGIMYKIVGFGIMILKMGNMVKNNYAFTNSRHAYECNENVLLFPKMKLLSHQLGRIIT